MAPPHGRRTSHPVISEALLPFYRCPASDREEGTPRPSETDPGVTRKPSPSDVGEPSVMIQPCDHLIDVMRRMSPGAMPLTRLQRELGLEAAVGKWTERGIRRAVTASDSGLRILELATDPPGGGRASQPLGAWVLITEVVDPSITDPIVHGLWQGLATLARRVDRGSRVGLSRWMLMAQEALAITQLIGGRGPPPTIPHPPALSPHEGPSREGSVTRCLSAPRGSPRERANLRARSGPGG